MNKGKIPFPNYLCYDLYTVLNSRFTTQKSRKLGVNFDIEFPLIPCERKIVLGIFE